MDNYCVKLKLISCSRVFWPGLNQIFWNIASNCNAIFLLKKKFVKSISFSYHPKVTFPSQVVEEEGDGGSSSSSSSVAVLSVPVVVLLAWNEN